MCGTNILACIIRIVDISLVCINVMISFVD